MVSQALNSVHLLLGFVALRQSEDWKQFINKGTCPTALAYENCVCESQCSHNPKFTPGKNYRHI